MQVNEIQVGMVIARNTFRSVSLSRVVYVGRFSVMVKATDGVTETIEATCYRSLPELMAEYFAATPDQAAKYDAMERPMHYDSLYN
jgi:hypothetical protein